MAADSAVWDTTVSVLRDPIFAVVLSLVLFVLAERIGGCLVKFVLVTGGIAALIWLLVRYPAVREVVVAIIRAAGIVVVVLIICLAVVALAGIAVVYAIYRRAEAVPAYNQETAAPLTALPDADESLPTQLDARGTRFAEIAERLTSTVENALGRRGEHSVLGVTIGYLSGPGPYKTELEQLRHDTDDLLRDLSRLLPSAFDGVDRNRLLEIASARSFFPGKADWEDATDEDVPYWLMRLLCLHPGWRTAGTILGKCMYGGRLVSECADLL